MDYRIIEFIDHLSFCKKKKFYSGDSEKKKIGHAFLFIFNFFNFFLGGGGVGVGGE